MRKKEAALRYFEEISMIPRSSGHERGVADYLVRFAAERGLWYHRDEMQNVYIKKPGTAGAENLPPVVLQGHTDMVCAARPGVEHDFLHDPLQLYMEGDRLRARGTTLGADNGVAAAIILALLTESEAVHPPLECLFTAQEEIGLKGAAALDPALITGRRMINLDAGPEGTLLIGAAGGLSLRMEVSAFRQAMPRNSKFLHVGVQGLQGGHSGADIGKDRVNAIKLLSMLLVRLKREKIEFTIAAISGGTASNVIPRECTAMICLPAARAEETRAVLAAAARDAGAMFAAGEPDMRIGVAEGSMSDIASFAFGEGTGSVLPDGVTDRLLNLLNLLPDGRLRMSHVFPDLVTLSLNMGVIRTKLNAVEITVSLRAGADSALEILAADTAQLASCIGAENIRRESPYPAWEPKSSSGLRSLLSETYRDLRGREPLIQAVHAGLECSVISALIPEMDIVAIGPDMGFYHTPDEWLDVRSLERTYEYVAEALKKMARNAD
ncbi:MAG: beta-Ala-His dipeptidase [Gracilibacteraceae bacterium]|jgi:dipeptidase D|nr:beta-Ala-His dipeptidase [Gracilibacteraceae bacterium]